MAAVHPQELDHHQFEDLVERVTTLARRVGFWPRALTITDEAPAGRWWSRRHIDQNRIVVYVARRTRWLRRPRSTADITAEIRRVIVRHSGLGLTPDQRLTRANALRHLTDHHEEGPTC